MTEIIQLSSGYHWTLKPKKKVMDVVRPRDNWERGYARLAYLHTELKQTFSKKVEVK